MALSADQSRAHLDITHIQTPTCSISLFVQENCETSTHPDFAKWQHLSLQMWAVQVAGIQWARFGHPDSATFNGKIWAV